MAKFATPHHPSLAIEYVSPAKLVEDPKNARKHSSKQITKLAASIEKLGFNGPLAIDESNRILCGHARYQAAKALGLPQVPCVRLTHLSSVEKTAFALADNKLHDLSSFDPDALRAQLAEIVAVDFDVEIAGFDTAEVDLLFDEMPTQQVDPDDAVELPEEGDRAISRLGDLWELDNHRLFCGDALSQLSYERVLAGRQADMVFTDPPYNVRIDGHVSGLGKVKHREFAMAFGEMSASDFEAFLRTALELCASCSVDGSIHFVCMDWAHVHSLLTAGKQAGFELKNICVWNKTNAGMGSLYRSKHELVVVYKNGKARHVNNVELGKHGRYRTNVWTYAGANVFSKSRTSDLEAHPTVKPVGLVADAIRDCSKRNALILDPFAGSGTIFLAAERTKRRAAGIELDPLYVDTAIRRWQRKTGKSARRASDQTTFDALEAR